MCEGVGVLSTHALFNVVRGDGADTERLDGLSLPPLLLVLLDNVQNFALAESKIFRVLIRDSDGVREENLGGAPTGPAHDARALENCTGPWPPK